MYDSIGRTSKYLIRKTVHSLFSANRIPTIDAVYREVQNNEEIPNISRSKLYKYIHCFQLTVNIEIYVYFK
jgi:hypothetical protein